MRGRCIKDQRDTWPVRMLCDALEISASGDDAWLEAPVQADDKLLILFISQPVGVP